MIQRLVVRGGDVVTAAGTARLDIIVADGVVERLDPEGAVVADGTAVVDATGLVVLPGVVDAHVHFIQDDPALFGPDPEEWEGFTAGGHGAAAGGVTTTIEMPQARPPATDGATFARKRDLAAADAVVDFALWGGVVQQSSAGDIAEQVALGAVGLKAFMCNSDPTYPGVDDDRLLAALTEAAAAGIPVGVHAENDVLLQAGLARMAAAGRTDPLAHAESRPPVVEVEAVSRAIVLAESAGAAVHIVHLSCGDAADTVARAKARGVDVTCETCPQYLLLDHDDLVRLRGFARCAPPIRARADVERLWERLADGTIDMIATDHCAFSYESKLRGDRDIFAAPCGLPAIETLLPTVAAAARARGFTFDDVARWTATAPARRFGLAPAKGAITVGADADLVLFDPAAPFVVRGAELHHTHRWTPYDGIGGTGRPVRTIVRGRTVFALDDGVVGPAGGGRFVQAHVRS